MLRGEVWVFNPEGSDHGIYLWHADRHDEYHKGAVESESTTLWRSPVPVPAVESGISVEDFSFCDEPSASVTLWPSSEAAKPGWRISP